MSVDVSVALLSSAEDVCYATGFEVPPPIDAGAAFAFGPTLAIVSAEGRTLLLVPSAYVARAEEMSRADETILVPTFGHFEQVDAREAFLTAVRAVLRDAGVGNGRSRVAIDDRTLPASVADMLRTDFADAELLDARAALRGARLIKTPRELDLLRRAVAVADVGQEALMEVAGAGRNELEVMGNVVSRVERSAAQPVPWTGELVTGPRTGVLRYPGGPIDRAMEAGDTVLMDLSVRYRGYWADCCNTFSLEREPTPEQLRYFRAARAAFEAAFEQLCPGRRASQVHAAAEQELERHGFRPAHYTGHQLGTAVNEDPRLVPYDHTLIEAGMVFAVEPGVYGGEQVGTGARTEKVVLVAEDGPELLSRFRWGMET